MAKPRRRSRLLTALPAAILPECRRRTRRQDSRPLRLTVPQLMLGRCLDASSSLASRARLVLAKARPGSAILGRLLPANRFGVLYLGSSLKGCFVEAVMRNQGEESYS